MCVDNKKTDFVLHNFHFYTANALIEVKISINDETKCFLSWFLNFVWTTVVNNYLTLCVNAIYDMFNSVIVGPNKKKTPLNCAKIKYRMSRTKIERYADTWTFAGASIIDRRLRTPFGRLSYRRYRYLVVGHPVSVTGAWPDVCTYTSGRTMRW